MAKFRKKPVTIEAEQFFENRPPYPAGVLYEMFDYPDGMQRPAAFRIDTLEGTHTVSDGDWIITGVKGEKYPCKPDIFAMTYEPEPDDDVEVVIGVEGKEAT